MPPYYRRLADATLAELLRELPALLLTGPRACGKTTTAARAARSVVKLDHENEAAAFLADPDVALASFEQPVLIDEWQVVPPVLGAVKRAVDRDSRPGQFLLTGSVRAEIKAPMWPATGRVIRLVLGPLTVAERLQIHTRPFIDRLVSKADLPPANEGVDLRGYIDLALTSGFPEAVFMTSTKTRRRWLEGYVDQIVRRDAVEIEPRRDPDRLRKYFEAYAAKTAGVVEDKTLHDAAGVSRTTGLGNERLLSNLFVVEALPAWSSNRLKRLTLAPKRHLIDPGLMVGALGLDVDAVLRNGDLLGRVLETFVVSHVLAEASYCESRPRLYHLRTEQGRHEIDLVAEIGAGNVVAIEVKATGAPKTADAAHLVWLRDQLGERFVRGVVMHTGPRTFSLGEKLVAAPISSLWSVGAQGG